MHLYSQSHQMIVLSCLVLFLCAFTSGVISNDHKHGMCCKEYEPKLPHPKIQIKRCYILPATADCLAAVTFTDTVKNMYCINPNARQLHKRMKILEEMGVTCKNLTKS